MKWKIWRRDCRNQNIRKYCSYMDEWNVPTTCAPTHTHKVKRANASRLAPSSNPCWSQPFLPASIFSLPLSLSRLWSEGASLLGRGRTSRGLISAKPMLQRWIHSAHSTTPCPLIHHLTLLRALLRAEGKEARGEAAREEEGAPTC